MKAVKIDVKNGVIRYHYKYSDLKKFLIQGFETGDNGMIRLSVKDAIIKYRGFGTIEAPSKNLLTMSVEHCDLFDGNLTLLDNTDCWPTVSAKIHILDLSGY